eukprot:7406710-Alexandrium_andersonii.AAC.1
MLDRAAKSDAAAASGPEQRRRAGARAPGQGASPEGDEGPTDEELTRGSRRHTPPLAEGGGTGATQARQGGEQPRAPRNSARQGCPCRDRGTSPAGWGQRAR